MYKLLKNCLSQRQKKLLLFLWYHFKHISFIKTFYINCKLFPLKEALKMPIIVGKNVILRKIGKISIVSEINPAMITLGVIYCEGWEDPNESPLILYNEGNIIIKGRVKHTQALKFITKVNYLLEVTILSVLVQ